MTANLHIGDQFYDARAHGYAVLRVVAEGPQEALYVVQSSPGAPLRLLRLLSPPYATHPLGTAPAERAVDPAWTSLEPAWLQTAAKLNLPTLSTAHETGRTASGQPYWLFAAPSAESLPTHLLRQGPLPADVAIDLACQLGDALEDLQTLGLTQPALYPDAIYVDGQSALAKADHRLTALRPILVCHGLRPATASWDGPVLAQQGAGTALSVQTAALARLLLGMLRGSFDEPDGARAGQPPADPCARLEAAPVSDELRRLLRMALSGEGQPSPMALPAFLRALRTKASAQTEPMPTLSTLAAVHSGSLAASGSPSERGPLALPSRSSYAVVSLGVALVGGLTYMLLRPPQTSSASPVVADMMPADGPSTEASAGEDLRAGSLSPAAPAPLAGSAPPDSPVEVAPLVAGVGGAPSSGPTPPADPAQTSTPPRPPSPPSPGRLDLADEGTSTAPTDPRLRGPARKPKRARTNFHIEAEFAVSPAPPGAQKTARDIALYCLASPSLREGLPVGCAVELSVRPKPDGGWIATIVRPRCNLQIDTITKLEVCISKQLARRAPEPPLKHFLLQRQW